MRHMDPAGLPRRALLVPVLACVANACARGAAGVAIPSSPHPQLRRNAPSFDKRDIAGRRVTPAAFAGRVWVVDFFAAYCAPCHERFAVLKDVMKDATIVGVSVDEDFESAVAQVHRFGLAFSVIHDPAHAVAGQFRVTSLPITFVMDTNNCVMWVADARVTREQFGAGLRQNIAATKVKRT